MIDSIRLDLTANSLWDHAPHTLRDVDGVQVRDRFRQGRYRIICAALEARTRQHVVVYEGVDGLDAGMRYSCPLADFAVRFLRVEEATASVTVEAPVPPVPPEAPPLNPLLEWAQRWATSHGEPVLLIGPGAPSPVNGTVSRLPYAVLLSQASVWERANALQTVEPERREKQ